MNHGERNRTESHGLTMYWSICKTHRGTWTIHGFIGNEQRMEMGFGFRKPNRERCEYFVTMRLAEIAKECAG